MANFLEDLKNTHHKRVFGALELLKYVGPGLLVTVGFIDPGNWASNLAAGSTYGYTLLWMVTLSTVMLIILQHNVAHLGIASGLCLSEAAQKHLPAAVHRPLLWSAMAASVSTSLAEILGGAIALQMLFGVPLKLGAALVTGLVTFLLLSNTYRRLEKWIIGFVSLIGLSFIYELKLAPVDWHATMAGWVTPALPDGSMLIVMSVLGAVVMPHNLFLHSEIIQSRQWNLEDEKVIQLQLKYEFADTLLSMLVGWAINSAMIIMAAATFYAAGTVVTELPQAREMLIPLLGGHASAVFALALLLAGVASSVTSGMAGASIFAGLFGEPMNLADNHSRLGVYISLFAALLIIFFVTDPFKGLIYSQMALSVQLPFTIFLQIYLTSSKKVMGSHANGKLDLALLLAIGLTVAYLNVKLLLSLL
ncbi:MAG TPA: Mg2+/Co2+ transporter [Elusimicrobia bacterium]|nr:MAG: Mg2+/Co2+ transporter [Elusimicrobia bacterium GWA2_64_40]HAN04642.1 Mg2+/Co2+ transporter [Elusimicrobiota bacterium]HAU89796.1 Mg2+/Co2+ transporter [Elusimicrobiota bacterium]